MEAVGSAHSMGIDAAFDAHTRLHGITNLSAALPANALLGGPDQVRARLTDPAFRDKMREYESLISSFALGGWDRVYLFKSKHLPEQVGKNFAALAPPGGDAFDAILDVLAAEADDPHAPMCICHSYEEEELRRTFQHPLCTVGSDATALAVDGPLAGKEFLGAFTWAAWFYRRMVRETGDLTIEEAIKKLAAAPADRLGLSDRGRIQKHARADLAIFDPQRFGERGTLDHPNQLAEGMSHVVVNGVVALQNGIPTGDRGGRVLRRP
jgi:N-acyl-D-amino-acid deacylase